MPNKKQSVSHKRNVRPITVHSGTNRSAIPLTVQPVIGIDVGVDGVHIGISDFTAEPKHWPVWYLEYASNDNWREILARLLDQETIVVAEPTGWHYLSPIAQVVTQDVGARLFLVEHTATGKIRQASLGMDQKTDVTDARTLAYIATQQKFGLKTVGGAWEFNWGEYESLLELRFMVNSHHKARVDAIRFGNRLTHLGIRSIPH